MVLFDPSICVTLSFPMAITRLIINATETEASDTAPDVLALAAQVYAGLSAAEIDDVQRIATDRSHCKSKPMASGNE